MVGILLNKQRIKEKKQNKSKKLVRWNKNFLLCVDGGHNVKQTTKTTKHAKTRRESEETRKKSLLSFKN